MTEQMTGIDHKIDPANLVRSRWLLKGRCCLLGWLAGGGQRPQDRPRQPDAWLGGWGWRVDGPCVACLQRTAQRAAWLTTSAVAPPSLPLPCRRTASSRSAPAWPPPWCSSPSEQSRDPACLAHHPPRPVLHSRPPPPPRPLDPASSRAPNHPAHRTRRFVEVQNTEVLRSHLTQSTFVSGSSAAGYKERRGYNRPSSRPPSRPSSRPSSHQT